MKNLKNISLIIYIILFVITVTISSCSKKISFLKSSHVPAARGTAKISKTSNNNYEINIKIKHLAAPSRLQPAKEAYIVWINTENNQILNLGEITSSTGFLSDKLKSSFTTVTPFNPVKVFISAENEARIQHPFGEIVLSTDTF